MPTYLLNSIFPALYHPTIRNLRKFVLLVYLFHLALSSNCQNDKGGQIMEAVNNNDTTKVKELLLNKKLLTYYDNEGYTALNRAVQLANPDIVRILLQSGADVNSTTKENLFTPLILAVKQHHLGITKQLLSHKADVNLADSAGRTPLIWCAINNDYEILPWLIKYGADLNKTTHYGNTALEMACWKKSQVSALILIIRGAEINTQSSQDKGTPLIYACMQAQYDLALELIRNGANVHAINTAGNGLLNIVAEDKDFIENTRFKYNVLSQMVNHTYEDSLYNLGFRSFFDYLLSLNVDLHQRNQEGYQPIHIASFNDNSDFIRELIKKGADVNDQKNVISATPLICALRKENKESVKLLMNYKINVQAKDTQGWTALHFASRDNDFKLAGNLIKAGAFVNVQNENGWTPLHLSAKNGQNEVTQILLYFGALDTFKNMEGKTASELAIEKKFDKTASMIINKTVTLVDLFMNGMEDFAMNEAKLNESFKETDLQGRTFLHAAIIRGYSNFAQYLISKGLDINAADSSGNTPLILAAQYKQAELAEILIDSNALVKVSDTLGMTALHYAVMNEDTGLIKLLIAKGADVNKRSKWEGTPLETASWYHDNKEIIEYLVSAGAEINSNDFKEWSPLSLAVRQRFTDNALWLIKHGADVNFKGKNGENILHLISTEMLGILLHDCINAGVKINEQTYDSLYTPLHFAVENNNLDFVKILYWNGANTSLKTIEGFTALDIAQKEGFNQIELFLKSPSFDPFELMEENENKILMDQIGGISYPLNIKNLKGMPFIHVAIENDYKDILEKLISAGADINIKDTMGRSPLLYALFIGNTELALRLIGKGANINLIGKDGETPYSVANRRGYNDIKEQLLLKGASKETKLTLKSELIIPKVQESFDYVARFSPNGQFVMTGSQNNNLTLWDAKSGRITRQFEGDFNSVADISFSPDGKLAVTVEGAHTSWILGYWNNFLNKRNINVWDIQTGEEVRVISGGSDYHRSSVEFSPDGKHICTGGYKGFIDVFDVGRGVCELSIEAHEKGVKDVCWTRDGRYILSAGRSDNELKLWDGSTGKLVKTFKGHTESVECIALSKKGELLISADASGEIIFWDIKQGTIIKSLKDDLKKINAMAISPDGNFFATAHGILIGQFVTRVRNTKTGKIITGFYEDNALVSVEFSKDSKSLLLACSGIPASPVKVVERMLHPEGDLIINGLPPDVTDFILTPDNKFVLTGNKAEKVFIKHLFGNRKIDSLDFNAGSISFIEISPFNKQLALIGTEKGLVVKFDLKSLKEVGRYMLHNAALKTIVFYKDGIRAATMDEEGELFTWSIQDGVILNKLNPPTMNYYRGFSISPDEMEFVIFGTKLLGYSFKTNVWQENLFNIYSDAIISVVWSKDGKQLWCKGMHTNYTVDILNGFVKQVDKSIIQSVWNVKYTNNLQYLLTLESWMGDMYLGLYDTRTEKCLQKVYVGDLIFPLVKISFDQKYLLFINDETRILTKVYLDPNQIKTEFKVPDIISPSIGLSPDGRFLYTSANNSVSRFQLSSQKRSEIQFKYPQVISKSVITSGESDFIFSNDSGSIYLCNFNKGTIHESVKNGLRAATAIAVSNDQKLLAGANANKRIYLWKLPSGTLIKTLSDSLIPSSLSFSNSNQSLFVGNSKLDYKSNEMSSGNYNMFQHSFTYLSEWNISTAKRTRIIDKSLFDFQFIKTSPDNLSMLAHNGSDFNFTIKQHELINFQTIYTISALSKSALNANFSKDSKKIVACYKEGGIEVFDLKDFNLNKLNGHKSATKNAVFSNDQKYIFSVSADNMVKAWDLKTSKELYSFLMVQDSNWIYLTPDNYYFASKGALKEMAWSVGGQRFDFDQFDLKYNRPDLLLRRIPYADTSLIPLYYKAYQKRLKKAGFIEPMLEKGFHVPEIEITNHEDLPATTKSEHVKVVIHASDSKELLDRIYILINEVPVYGMKGIDLKKERISDFKSEYKLKLSQGMNKIEVSVLNNRGVESTKETFFISYETEEIKKPVLHFVAVSVSEYKDSLYNLSYAVKDGRDMAKLFSKKNELYDSVVIDTLFNKNATLNTILSVKKKLMKTHVDDQVILFVSGHGLLDDSLDFYFGAWDIDFNNPSTKGVPYDVLENLLDGIPARRKILLMDACHSGETDKEELESKEKDSLLLSEKPDTNLKTYGFKGAKLLNYSKNKIGLQNSFELMQTLFSDQTHNSGAIVVSAAAGKGYALESALWNNGVFTFSVLEGLLNQSADLNKDHEIYISELKTYVSNRVETLTGGRQKPTTRNENLGNDFRVW